MERLIDRYGTYILFGAIFLSFFATLSLAPLFDLDEGAFSEATREMLLRGDYITTYLNGELRFDKPILIYWLQALSVTIFGENEFAFRLPSALAATVWVLAVYKFTKNLLGTQKAFLASFMMSTSLQITIIAKAAIADALLNMFIALSMFNLYLYMTKKEKRYLYFTFAFIGFGALTKGPVAILIPLAVFFIDSLFKKELRFFFRSIFDIKGIVIFSIVALPWYVAEYMQQGSKFIEGFFLKHNISRFQTAFEGHGGSLLYYVPVVLIGTMPYTWLVFKSLKRVKEWFEDDLKRFLGIWFLFVFLFFSFSGTKLPHYVIYGYTPLFILMSIYGMEFKKTLFIVPSLIFATILLFLPEIALAIKDSIKDPFAKEVIELSKPYFDIYYRLYFVLFLAILLIGAFKELFDKMSLVIAVGFMFTVGINFFVIKTYGEIAQRPIKEAALIVKKSGFEKIVMYGLDTPSFMVYSKRLVEKRKPKAGDIVLTKKSALKNIKAYETIYEKNGILLIKVTK